MFLIYKIILEQNNLKINVHGIVVNSALTKTVANKRFLEIDSNTVALVIHPNYVFEAVLTPDKADNKNFTEEELLLLALVIHLKQDGFADMLVSELHRIALKNDSLFNEYGEKNINNK